MFLTPSTCYKLLCVSHWSPAVNIHSSCNHSSQISEMSQEPRPVSRDCIYPALVGCSAPVEVVLPQISSNMWWVKGNVLLSSFNQFKLKIWTPSVVNFLHRPRGFGQLVRARNIKTVGDLSALTPSEIKTLPIRSPKVSIVKKALRVYEQQVRRGQSAAAELWSQRKRKRSRCTKCVNYPPFEYCLLA